MVRKNTRILKRLAWLLPALLAIASNAQAQPVDPNGIALDRYEPPEPGDAFMAVPSPWIGGHLVPRLMLTYNVAGLPETLSGSRPAEYTPQISPLLNAYDVVVVQEDFWYHHLLVADVTHAYRSVPMVESPTLTNMGDGLNRFFIFPIEGHERVTWADCNGTIDCSSDCLTPKGFSYARHQLSSGVLLAVYNLHMDAGSCGGDFTARGVQVDQLIADINSRSAGQAVIVAGDTNLSDGRSDDMVMLDRLMTNAGLTDACRALGCGSEELDRVLFRSSASLTLQALTWAFADEFVDPSGHDLSDHPAIRVEISWEAI